MEELKMYTVSREEFIAESKIPLNPVSDVDTLYRMMADEMVRTINEKKGDTCVLIVPVGPVLHYNYFVERVNREKISLKNVYFFNMDEYLGFDGRMIDENHPLSFVGFMKKNVYDKIDPQLVMGTEKRIFPTIGFEGEIESKIEKLGGVDLCVGSSGINGHIAFNEPPEPGDTIDDEEFWNLPTRALDISRETLTINAARMLGGAFDIIPKRCITIGMREILSSREIKMYVFRDWQWGNFLSKICRKPSTVK
jgi:glucosamine-6-phosphate deaminase